MNSKNQYLIKNVGILTVSNFASKILTFLLVPLYTSVLTAEEVGVYDIAVTTSVLVFPIFTLNIVDALMRFFLDKDNSKIEVASIGIKYIVLSVIPAIILLLIGAKIEQLKFIHGYEAFIFLYYLFYSLYQYLVQFAKGLGRVADMGTAGVLGTVAMMSANLLLLLVFKAGLKGFFIANIMGVAIPSVFLVCRLKIWDYIVIGNINKKLNREMLVYCTPLIATAVGWWVNSASDKYVVSIICGIEANGVLSVAYKIPAIINTLQSIFIQAWQISAIKEYGKKESSEFYGKTFRIINLILSISCAALVLFTKPIGYILFKKEFYVAWKYVPFLLIASVLNSASGFLGPILSAKKASKPMAMSAVYGASVNVLLNILFVYYFSIQGATIATLISSLVIYMVRKRAVGNEIVIKNYKNVCYTWGLLVLQAILEIYTRFWMGELVIILIAFAINKRTISEIFRIEKLKGTVKTLVKACFKRAGN